MGYILMKRRLLSFLLCVPVLVAAQVADTASVARQVDSLIQVSRALTGQRDFDKALEVNAVAERLAREKLGRETAAYGGVCFDHGRVLYFIGDYPEAEKWYLEAMPIWGNALGKEHPDYANCLSSLGVLYLNIGNYEKSELFYLQAKAIRGKVLGESKKGDQVIMAGTASRSMPLT